MTNPFFKKKWYYLTYSCEDKGIHTIPKGICPKVNVIARLTFELAYNDSTVLRFKYTVEFISFVSNIYNSTFYVTI